MNFVKKLEKEEQNKLKKLENVVSERAEENKILFNYGQESKTVVQKSEKVVSVSEDKPEYYGRKR
jgi:hypothetical protein